MSVAVRPFHWAWFMKPHEPEPPLLFTIIMKAMVTPRSTSSDSRRWTGAGASEGLFMMSCILRFLERVSKSALLFQPQPELNTNSCFQEYYHCDNIQQRGVRLSISGGWRSAEP